ncbi:vps72p [Saccharomyces arboricola H-6]|uniref:Vps72p n=1 Tax=Saccharomyces arboricola (strain H-6 / AS 2.3317 / CBS 10644) TaxID=1160507 RepID=J8PJA1_SACAR|nr:vps72p [Saccharomyces arboricola H-6]
MSDGSSDNDVESGTEFIIQSRSRRANAGNRLKKLLEQELSIESTERQLSSYKNGEDDEDEIVLLFQEDGEDEDFEITEEDHKCEGGEEQGEEDDEEDEARSITKEPTKITNDQAADDLMFSSSESEGSDNEDDGNAEENEIRRQELLSRKKRNKKLQKGPVIVKKQKPKLKPVTEQPAPRSHHNHEQLNAETLLLNTRRTSKRSSVMENTMKVYEKLSKAEKKRKIIQERIRKHKEQESKYILTQAERLRIAKETEKFNILSLDKFKEQEIWKKENRLALQKRQKLKFQPGETILQFLSTAWIMTPVMELDDYKYWQEQVSKRDKKKKKYPRKPKKNLVLSQQDAQDSKKEQDSINSIVEGPAITNQETTITDEISSNNGGIVEGTNPHISVPATNHEESKSNPISDATFDATAGVQKSSTVDVVSDNKLGDGSVMTTDTPTNTNDISQNPQNKNTKDELINLLKNKESDSNESWSGGKPASQSDDELVASSQPDTPGMEDTILVSTDTDIKEEIASSVKSENLKDSSHSPLHDIKSGSETTALKQVTFSDSPQVAIIDTEESPLKKDTTNTDDSFMENLLSAPIYEGPGQLTSRNFITLYDFPNTPPNLKDFNTNLFGSQWTYSNISSTTQRPQDLQTVFHTILPLASQPSVSSSRTDVFPDLSALANFPSFGEYDKKIVHEISTETNKDLEIKIKTQPPTGVFLANGIRKKCLITNKECQYFDPRTGVPYSDVEAYKIIQQIQDPISKEEERTDIGRDERRNGDAVDQARFKWFGFKNGGIYLDLNQRPANGVPEGF